MCEAVKVFREHSSSNSATGDIFLTTKVTGKEHGTNKTEKAVEESIARAAEYGLVWVSDSPEVQREHGLTREAVRRTCSCCTTRQVGRSAEGKRGKFSSAREMRAKSGRLEYPTL